MEPRILGLHPLARDDQGRLRSRIATVFPDSRTIVTLPGIHATQRMAYVDMLDAERRKSGLAPLTCAEQSAEWDNAVDLITEDDAILIRPDPGNMTLAFRADEVLQELVPKQRIRFLYVLDERVREAVKRRGECWRITPLPKSADEMRRMIAASRIGIHGEEIYYYNNAKGTRFLTCQEFARLGNLDEPELRRHLAEIRQYSLCANRLGNPEIDFFLAGRAFQAECAVLDFSTLDSTALRSAHLSLRDRFRDLVPPELRADDLDNVEWRSRMFAALISHAAEEVSEETLLGLGSEFFMQIEWLPGGRIEEGELMFDPVLDEKHEEGEQESAITFSEKSRRFIFNFVRDYGDLEYVNIGRVVGSLSHRRPFRGRRGVYIAEMKRRDSAEEIVKIIRMQKWGVREHLDEGKDLLQAMIESEEYTEYILDRRLACRQLGMSLPACITARKISETYYGNRREYHGITIWSPYFERDYVHGVATDKIPLGRFENDVFASRFAALLGRAAAANMIMGRCDPDGTVVFDDGDEVVIENKDRLPAQIVVADHTGTFVDCRSDLETFGADYAAPINKRLEHVSNPEGFANTYLRALAATFSRIQRKYRRRKRAFDTLLKHRRRDEAGSLAYRWELVLKRLNRTDPRELQQLIRDHLALASRSPG
ncbi:MAG: hypothetical protein ACYC35_19405 [Pirellulales bacterium]